MVALFIWSCKTGFNIVCIFEILKWLERKLIGKLWNFSFVSLFCLMLLKIRNFVSARFDTSLIIIKSVKYENMQHFLHTLP